MAIPMLIAAAGLALMCVFLSERIHGTSPSVTVMKAVVSLFFLMTAMAAFAVSDGPQHFGLLIVVGLMFGLTGDIWLDLRYVVPSSEKLFTYAGIIAFSIGHIFYDFAIASTFFGNADRVAVWIPLPVSAAAAVAVALLSEKIFGVKYGSYKAIIAVYSGILISFTAYAAAALVNNPGAKNAPLILLAASVLFMVSDGILNAIYFKPDRNRPAHIFFNHIFYYLAQFSIALSICFVSGNGLLPLLDS